MKNSRVNKILEGMAKEGLSQMIITSPASIFYLTGKWIYPGERMIALYINQNGDHKLVINKLFPVYEDLGVEMIWYEDTENPIDYLNRCINKNEILGIEEQETMEHVADRIDKCIRNIAQANIGKTILISSHGVAIEAFLRKISGIPFSQEREKFCQYNVAINELEYENDKFKIIQLANIDYLNEEQK